MSREDSREGEIVMQFLRGCARGQGGLAGRGDLSVIGLLGRRDNDRE